MTDRLSLEGLYAKRPRAEVRGRNAETDLSPERQRPHGGDSIDVRIGDIGRRGRRVRVAEHFLGDPDVVAGGVDLSGEPVPQLVGRRIDAVLPEVAARLSPRSLRTPIGVSGRRLRT